jgi:hypothetical protein
MRSKWMAIQTRMVQPSPASIAMPTETIMMLLNYRCSQTLQYPRGMNMGWSPTATPVTTTEKAIATGNM